MTHQQINEALAKLVFPPEDTITGDVVVYGNEKPWAPTSDISQAFMVVDALEGRGLFLTLGQAAPTGWSAGFISASPGVAWHNDKDRNLAISIAALKAIGEYNED